MPGSFVTVSAQQGDALDADSVEAKIEGQGEALSERTIAGIEMVWIPAGAFKMGVTRMEKDRLSDEQPQHQVTLTQGFWMGKYEVTKAQWEAVAKTKPWSGRAYVLDDLDSPAVYVSWSAVQDFIAALNEQSGEHFRLPTEAEWEYACRGGTSTRFSHGDDSGYAELGAYAWCEDNAANAGEEYAHAVGRLSPNSWGLHDMYGNVWEWCSDRYGDKYYGNSPETDPPGPRAGAYRVKRGGSWLMAGMYCRSALRSRDDPGSRNSSLGFRLCR